MYLLVRGTLILGVGLFLAAVSTDATAQRVRLEARMEASAGPESGKARFRQRGSRRRFTCEVEDAGAGVQLKICLKNGTTTQTLGVVTTDATGTADLNLDTGNGQGVLAMNVGDVIIVKKGAAVLMSGGLRSR